MENTLLVLHILAAATWLGANVVQAFVTPRMRKADNIAAAEWHRATVAFGVAVYSPAAVLLLLTGFGLVGVSDGAYGYGDTFVLIGIVAVVVGAVLGIRFFGPNGEKAAAAYDNGDRADAEAVVSRVSLVGVADTVLLVFVIVVMVNRWGA